MQQGCPRNHGTGGDMAQKLHSSLRSHHHDPGHLRRGHHLRRRSRPGRIWHAPCARRSRLCRKECRVCDPVPPRSRGIVRLRHERRRHPTKPHTPTSPDPESAEIARCVARRRGPVGLVAAG